MLLKIKKMAKTKIQNCRNCNAEIVFKKWLDNDGNERYMPCDPAVTSGLALRHKNFGRGARLITADGQDIKRPGDHEFGYLPHYFTCENPDYLPKRGQKR